MMWDLCLYVPTVLALFLIGVKLWFGPNQNWTYLLFFLASFFLISGSNRILKTRLLLLPTAPIALRIGKQRVGLQLRSGNRVELVKDVRFFPDHAGKSFAITGMDLNGKKQQYIIGRGQFADDSTFKDAKGFLQVYR